MTITKALRKLYKVIVGEEAPANANTITKVLLALAEAWTGGGGSGGGEIDPGYSCTETTTLLTDESVTTVDINGLFSGDLAYSTPINADTIKVTFNGTEYVCDAIPLEESVGYGGATGDGNDFSEYPFAIYSDKQGDDNLIITETAGTYQVKIEAISLSVTITPCFKKAVESVHGTVQPN